MYEHEHGADHAPEQASTIDLVTLSYREMLAVTRERATREYLCAVLVAFDGSVPRAAAHAGVERESFYRLLKRYGVNPKPFRWERPAA